MTLTTSPRQSRDFSPPSPLLPEKAPGVARPFIHTARLRFDRFEPDEAEARLHGELRAEIERGAWYVLPPDPHLVLRKPSQGLREELVRISKLRANSI
jgi:hypothetical protein